MEWLHTLKDADIMAVQGAISMLEACGRRGGNNKYPFGNPVSIERSHLDTISKRQYMVADKSDGVRICFIMCCVDTTMCAVVMDRVGKIRGVSVQADRVLFNGTIIDAEIVRKNDGGYQILAFDVCVVAGNHEVEHMYLMDRLSLMALALRDVVVKDALLTVKPMFLTEDEDGIRAHMGSVSYATDGYILTPNCEPTTGPGTAPTVLKIKECHTIDFLWNGTTLWYGDNKELFPIASLHLQFDGQQLRHLRPGTIVEMSPQKNTKTGEIAMMHLVQERPDKDTPNNYVCVKRTMQSIADNVTLSEVHACSLRQPDA
jgi:hypothetical protein